MKLNSNIVISVLCTIIAASSLFSVLIYTHQKEKEISHMITVFENSADEIAQGVAELNQVQDNIESSVKNILLSSVGGVVNKEIKKYDNELDVLNKKKRNEYQKLLKLVEKSNQDLLLAQNDILAESKDFEQVCKEWSTVRFKTFETKHGSLQVHGAAPYKFNDKAAYIMLEVTGGDVLQAYHELFLQIINTKKACGYKKIYYRKPTKTTYGHVYESLYEKGDYYIRLSVEYIRVQGTYNSTNYRYKAFIDMGSYSLKKQFKHAENINAFGS